MSKKIFKVKLKRDRRSEALTRLRERWEKEHPDEEWEAEKEPIITPLFKSVEGGVERVLEALRAHDDGDAQEFIEFYDSIGKVDRSFLPLECVAFGAGLTSLRLAEVAQTALYLYASMQTKMLISTAMPKVTRSIIKAATDEVPIIAKDFETGDNIVVGHTNGDVKAMELFGKMSGIVPIPKGATIAIQNNFGEKEDEGEAPKAATWRDPEDRLREFHDLTEPKRLPSPQTPPITIGGHIDVMQQETVEILRGE